MARPQSRFVCQGCGESFLRWEGQCRACGAWNSLVEMPVRAGDRREREGARRDRGSNGGIEPVPLSRIEEAARPRLLTGIEELDRVLGGGLVTGSVVLLGGEPGIGKSTLVLQAAAGVARGEAARDEAAGAPRTGERGRVLYATGEESASQVRLRAARLGLAAGPVGDAILVAAESEVGRLAELARAARPAVMIVDSIQTMTVDELDGPAGSVGQVRESALRLMEIAKGDGIAVLLVGHVTKDGSLAGPKTLEHLVDAVLTLEGERYAALRLVRATKNRFGSTDEVGVFEMGEDGLLPVADPARAFLGEHDEPAPGSVVAATLEGSRPLLVEVQALVSPGGFGPPRRTAIGLDANRLALLIAVLGRRAGVGLGTHDVYANLAGGLAVDEPALDLPLALALASSLRDRPVSPATIALGEVGLLGELRPVSGLERRLREAARLGFRRAIVPRPRGDGTPSVAGLEVVVASTLRQALAAALPGPEGAGGDGRSAEPARADGAAGGRDRFRAGGGGR